MGGSALRLGEGEGVFRRGGCFQTRGPLRLGVRGPLESGWEVFKIRGELL